MRSELVHTHYRCNQNCRYCTVRRAVERWEPTRFEGVRERIEAALAGGARELVITGGEPGMRGDLPQVVGLARSRGAARVVLETNGTLLDGPRAVTLRRAGLHLVRLNLSGWGPGLDEVTRDPGGFALACDGLRALLGAGLTVEVSVALTRSTLPLLAPLPAGLAALLDEAPGWRACFEGLVARVPVESPDPSELLSYPEAAEALALLVSAARAEELPVRVAPDSGPPPCVMPGGAQHAHLYSLTPASRPRDGHRRIEACATCRVADRCSGLPAAYLDRHGPPPARPVDDDRFRRRLSLIGSVREQVRREFVMVDRVEQPGRPVQLAHLIRVNFHCNQSCRFCFVSTHLPSPGDEAVRQAITAAAAAGCQVVLTGGEPTLNPHLVEYVRLAHRLSPLPVHLQTNATRLGEAATVRALVEAGLAEAFVSLHGSSATVSDAVTEAPGTFEQTVAGIDRLTEAGVFVIVNFVICRRNQHDITDWVRLCAARWPAALLNFSFVAPSSDVVPREPELVPRYREVLPELSRAVAEASRAGMKVTGFESMCGVPLCLVPAPLGPYFQLGTKPPGGGDGEFIKPPACGRCALSGQCHGVRRGYLELYGDEDLSPVDPAAERTA